MAFDQLVVSFFVDEMVGGLFVNVPPGHVACVYDLGRGVLKKVWSPGLHFKIPFWQKAKLFNAQVLEYSFRNGFDLNQKEALGDEPLEINTADNQEVVVEGSLLLKINKEKTPQLWENIGENFVSKVVRPVTRSRIRSCLAGYSLKEILSRRLIVEGEIKKELNAVFAQMGLIVENVLLSNIKTNYQDNPSPAKNPPPPKATQGTTKIIYEKGQA